MQRGSGLIDLEELSAAIRPDTVACSVMAVNNEIGVVQPLKEIGEICRKNKVFFHSDIAQMLGKVGDLAWGLEGGSGEAFVSSAFVLGLE